VSGKAGGSEKRRGAGKGRHRGEGKGITGNQSTTRIDFVFHKAGRIGGGRVVKVGVEDKRVNDGKAHTITALVDVVEEGNIREREN